MSATPTTSPLEQIAAFDEAFATLKPAADQQLPIAQRLELFRDRIVARHKDGYTWKQIAEVLRQPKFGFKVSEVTLRRLFNDKPKTVKRRAKRITSIRVLPPIAPSA